jgi:hypothetical protein
VISYDAYGRIRGTYRDYLADPEWDRAVAMAAGLERQTKQGTPAEQVPLFGDLPSFMR